MPILTHCPCGRCSFNGVKGLCRRCFRRELVRRHYYQGRDGGKCRHCKGAEITRPRGLCWHCYYASGVRDLYPITSKPRYHDFLGPALPCEPTDARPGTQAKIEVLRGRADRREELFHPLDPKDLGQASQSSVWWDRSDEPEEGT
jgi:hypothetical protein